MNAVGKAAFPARHLPSGRYSLAPISILRISGVEYSVLPMPLTWCGRFRSQQSGSWPSSPSGPRQSHVPNTWATSCSTQCFRCRLTENQLNRNADAGRRRNWQSICFIHLGISERCRDRTIIWHADGRLIKIRAFLCENILNRFQK